MNLDTFKNPYVSIYAVLVAGLLGLCLYFHLLNRDYALSLLHEDGLVEILSALGYFVCVGVMLFLGRGDYMRLHYPLALVVTLLGLRELDFDKRFTETGLLQSRIFTSPDVILGERIAGLLVMTGLILLILYIVRYYLFIWVTRLIRFDMVAVGIALAVGLMVFSKSIDGLGRKLRPLGITIGDQTAFSAIAFEEVFELGIPIVLTIVAIGYFRQLRPHS